MPTPAVQLPPDSATDPPSRRYRLWLWTALASVPAVVLLASDLAYALVAVAGMLIFLPLGALSWVLIWLSLLATTVLMSPLLDPLATRAASSLGLADGSREQAERRLRWITWLLLAATLLAGLTLRTPSVSSPLPTCKASDVPRFGWWAVGSLMGHGSQQKPAACRGINPPQPGPWVPLLVTLAMLPALHRATRKLRQVRLVAEGPTQGPGPTLKTGTRRVVSSAADADAQQAVTAANLARPPPVALSERSRALLETRRRSRQEHASTLPRTLIALPQRWPLLSIGFACYLGGWVLELAGSSLAMRVAEALSPAMLRDRFTTWAVLGIWASTLIAVAGVGLLRWARRHDD